jgi:hypothetical protein
MHIRHAGIWGIGLLVTAAVAIQIHAAASVDGQQYAGTWNGNWEGAGSSGRFDLTIQVGADGRLGGGVSVGSDQGDYTAKFSKIVFTGNKMTGNYDYPLDAQGEVSVTGTFDAKGASGTWGLGAKGQSGGQTMADGTWKTEKK